MEIPHSQVPEQTLLAIIEEFISREGTDYGHREYTLDEKVEKVKSQLLNGEIKLYRAGCLIRKLHLVIWLK